MDAYLIPIKTAVLVFFGLANMIAIPLLFWEYHKKGALTIFKGTIIYSFIFYLMTAFFMTLLPLPSKEFVASLMGPYAQLVPFMFVKDIITETVFVLKDTSTYLPALTQGVFLQVIFNVVLTIPFGIYLRYYFKKDLKHAILFTFLMSLFYEVTQITGVYGIYPRPYRLFDVDDLMLNTLGGVVGYYITPAIVFLFPTRQEIEEKVSLEASRVPFLRRVFAYVIDYNLIAIVIRISIFFMDLNKYTLNLLVALVLAFIYFIFKGKSVGLKLMNLKISSTTNKRLTLTQSLKRSLLYTISYNLIFLISLDFFNYLNNIEKDIRYILLFYIILMFVSQFIMILHVFHNAILKKTPLFYERLSKTKIVSDLK